jgi:uncharacterized protein (TIGR00730 family)
MPSRIWSLIWARSRGATRSLPGTRAGALATLQIQGRRSIIESLAVAYGAFAVFAAMVWAAWNISTRSEPVVRDRQYVCVFTGASTGNDERFAEAAREFARCLARRELGLVYGAGRVGLMGIIADEALSLGVPVIGVVPHFLVGREVAHDGLTERIDTETMLERKSIMAERSDAFVALPGGFGTLDEIFEMITWTQLDVHDKLTGLLNVDGYFDPLLEMIDRAIDKGFIRPEYRRFVSSDTDADSLMARLL